MTYHTGPMAAEYDAVVIGGGPAGATVAERLAAGGHRVALVERGGRIKPCGGAIPPRAVTDFRIPDSQICARIDSARMISPSGCEVDMPIEGGFVGMVDREHFDEWLRERAVGAGATRIAGRFTGLETTARGDGRREMIIDTAHGECRLVARLVVGADGANSAVGKAALGKRAKTPFVFAYHEIVETPESAKADATRCDVFYQGRISPDFYGWVFPHGSQTSIGTGSAKKGEKLRDRVDILRMMTGYDEARTVRREGAPIPLKPLARWDDGRNIILAGDAAGVVAPCSGEGIYYAMESGRMVAEAGADFLATGDAKALRAARKAFMADHGQIFRALRVLQAIWYRSDWLRERFVAICRNPDVQRLTWESYMHKRMAKASHKAHARILWDNVGHYFGWRTA